MILKMSFSSAWPVGHSRGSDGLARRLAGVSCAGFGLGVCGLWARRVVGAGSAGEGEAEGVASLQGVAVAGAGEQGGEQFAGAHAGLGRALAQQRAEQLLL